MVTVTVPATIPFINGGKLRGLAILATARGHPDIVERLNSELRKIMHAPETVKQLNRVGIDAVTSTAAEFQAFIKTDAERWAKVIKDANIRIG